MYKLEAGLSLSHVYIHCCLRNAIKHVMVSHQTVSPSMLGKLPWLYLSSGWNILRKFKIYIILFSFCDIPCFCLSIFLHELKMNWQHAETGMTEASCFFPPFHYLLVISQCENETSLFVTFFVCQNSLQPFVNAFCFDPLFHSFITLESLQHIQLTEAVQLFFYYYF